MTKAALVDLVSERTDLPRTLAEDCFHTLLDGIWEAPKRVGDNEELRGFGSFNVRVRHGHRGRNARTDDKVRVPPKRVPYFKAGRLLREQRLEESG